MEHWVNFITDNKTERITDIDNFKFLDAKEDDVIPKYDTVELNGADGILPGQINFEPFKLVLRFSYKAIDYKDYLLFKSKMRGVFFKKAPFYIVHSKMPGKKYAVISDNNSIDDKTDKFGEFEVSFVVYKGFSESVNTTDDEFFFDSNWMFENGIPLDFEPKYHHTSSQFTIWNGSTDTIDPRNIHHQLQIKMNIKATDGFELVNYTTGDIFRYNKSISPGIDFVLSGVHAYYDNNKVGIDTNRGIITLAPGKNILKIRGDVSSQNVVFKFPFIYR
ncbi:phage tail family protein [Staphylococcus equorum]|uniref:phage tail family protein n=1 Tax=Staphylococcus equorum TaxID=246432 RepID=UPI002556D469|nr:phage tail family protein [Staphylococcus equorum]MDK9851021.1 phage tail family protein [Staphylococcus equorum]